MPQVITIQSYQKTHSPLYSQFGLGTGFHLKGSKLWHGYFFAVIDNFHQGLENAELKDAIWFCSGFSRT